MDIEGKSFCSFFVSIVVQFYQFGFSIGVLKSNLSFGWFGHKKEPQKKRRTDKTELSTYLG